jgi:putative PIG3 family NAD(P)H quinone oxidoreductase
MTQPTHRALDLRDGRLVPVEQPTPAPGPDEVRIAVHAAGVNRADLSQRAGNYPPPPGASPILGLEVAGVVEAVGEGVVQVAPGDRVMALLAGGGYAEQVVCRADATLPLPAGASFVEGAAFPEVFATAWLNLVHEGALHHPARPGASALIHAGASGVGTAAVQICRLLGVPSFVTVGSAAKVEVARSLGADGGAVRHEGPWLPAVRAWRPDGVAMILDPVGAAWLDDNLRALAIDGVLVAIGLLSGRRAELDLGRVLTHRLRIQGSTLRSRSDAAKAALLGELAAHVVPAWVDGRLRPILDQVHPWLEADAAHARMADNVTVGAQVLRVRPEA